MNFLIQQMMVGDKSAVTMRSLALKIAKLKLDVVQKVVGSRLQQSKYCQTVPLTGYAIEMRTHYQRNAHHTPVTNLHTPDKQNNGAEKKNVGTSDQTSAQIIQLFAKEGINIPHDDGRIKEMIGMDISEKAIADAILQEVDTALGNCYGSWSIAKEYKCPEA